MEKGFTVEELQALMKSVADNKLGGLLLECGSYKLKIKGTQAAPAVQQVTAQAASTVASAAAADEVSVQEAPQAQAPAATGRFITSPIVGTYYSAGAPDADPFVQVGQVVKEGDTVFIVESMKVMNEVPADKGGIVAEILAQDGDPVEYGQPVLRLE